MDGIDGRMIGLLERLLDVASRRQQLIGSNIANVDTPGYQTRDLDFERAMKQANASGGGRMRTTDPRHLPAGPGSGKEFPEYEPAGLPLRNDFNNVSVDREMLALAQTAGRYATAIELIRKRFAILKYALMDGRNG